MKVAIEYTPAVRQRAGIGRFVRELTAAVLALGEGCSFTLVLTRDAPLPPLPARVVRLPLTERQALVLWHRWRLPLPIDRWLGPVDLFHGTNFLLPPLRRPRAVVTVHDLSFLLYPQFAEPALVAFLRAAVPRSLQRAQAICADSAATKRDLIQHLGVAAARITVIPGGVDPRFRPAPPTELARVRQRYPLDRPFLLALGTREPRKNLAGLLAAYQLVRHRGATVRLLIAGPPGWREAPFAAALASAPYREDVIALGYVPDEDLPALLSACACFVYPSFYEGFGLPVGEALACGAPVVCSATSSLPEVAGEAALLVPPDDPAAIAEAILRVLEDETLAARLRSAGPRQAATLRWEDSARALLALYHQVVA
jgi:glycosyltransferase involved in cell wall biosynthesis